MAQYSLDIFQFSNLSLYRDRLIHGLSMKTGGASKGIFSSLNLGFIKEDQPENILENYKRFSKIFRLKPDQLVIGDQSHSDEVLEINEKNLDLVGIENTIDEVDGFMTNLKNVPLTVRFADCQGVFFFDPIKNVIAAVHSGWRGNVQNIIGKTVEKMVKTYGTNPEDLIVSIGPSLGPCCAEFTDPQEELPDWMHVFVEGRNVNLWNCSLHQLAEQKVKAANVELAGICTVCNSDKFFSHRAGKGKTGHMAGLIMLT